MDLSKVFFGEHVQQTTLYDLDRVTLPPLLLLYNNVLLLFSEPWHKGLIASKATIVLLVSDLVDLHDLHHCQLLQLKQQAKLPFEQIAVLLADPEKDVRQREALTIRFR